jgi:predicted acylesterase/phospholipase RssA
MDGGVASNLPVEPALALGATEIIALDVDDPRAAQTALGLAGFLGQLILTAQLREKEMELALAAARRVPVHHIALCCEQPVPLWDFSHTQEAIERGYRLACDAVERQGLARRARTAPGRLSLLRLGRARRKQGDGPAREEMPGRS